jgi:hypothetical protein
LKIQNITVERFPHARILKGNLKIGLQIAKGIAGIVMLTLEAKTEKTLLLAK